MESKDIKITNEWKDIDSGELTLQNKGTSDVLVSNTGAGGVVLKHNQILKVKGKVQAKSLGYATNIIGVLK